MSMIVLFTHALGVFQQHFVCISSLSSGGVADITMKEAVEYLSNKDETYQHCGASYIQHNTFIDESAKEEVVYPVSYSQTASNFLWVWHFHFEVKFSSN